jgi:hypothetical protein
VELVLCYRSWSGLQRDCRGQLAMGGLLVRSPENPALFSPALLRLETPDGQAFVLEGQVVQVIPGQGTAVQFGPAAAPAITALRALCAAHPDPAPPDAQDPRVGPPGEPDPPDGEQAAEPAEPLDSSQETKDLLKRLEQMSVNDRRREALHGQRAVRALLIRDRNKTLHQFVLRNPSITLDEVEQFAKMPGVSPDALRMMAANPEWNRSAAVCRNLIKNPKTPLKEALDLMNRLPLSEVRILAKSQHVRTAIQQAARRKVNS